MPFVGEYSYADLLSAVENDPSPENVNALGEWFDRYGQTYWNGEAYIIDERRCIVPIYQPSEQYDGCDIIGYKLEA